MDVSACEPLVRALAGRVYRRLRAAGGRIVSIEDIRQELWIAVCKARDTYDDSQGASFSTYAWNGMLLHINRWIFNEFERNGLYNAALSIDWNGKDRNGVERDESFSETLPDTFAEDPETVLIRKSNYEGAMRLLSPEGRTFLRLLQDEAPEIGEAMRAFEAKADFAATRKLRYGVPSRLTASIIFDLMGTDRTRRTAIMAELNKVAARLSR